MKLQASFLSSTQSRLSINIKRKKKRQRHAKKAGINEDSQNYNAKSWMSSGKNICKGSQKYTQCNCRTIMTIVVIMITTITASHVHS